MADITENTESGKRPASALDAATEDGPLEKKQKDAPFTDAEIANREPLMKFCGFTADDLDFHSTPRDELKEIMEDINAGTHLLVLERNNGTNAKCRADKCLVESEQYNGENIQAHYRVNLQELRPTNEHWSQRSTPVRRFFHVTCIEAIGVHLSKYLDLQVAEPSRAYGVVIGVCNISFHPAITDWLKNDGKTFEAALYKNDDYEKARETYKRETREKEMRAAFSHGNRATSRGNSVAEHITTEPVEPKIGDFLSADEEMRECGLTDVLLDVMGGGHLVGCLSRFRLRVLEIWGRVPSSLSEASIEAKLNARKMKTPTEDDKRADGERETDGNTMPADAPQEMQEDKARTADADAQDKLTDAEIAEQG